MSIIQDKYRIYGNAILLLLYCIIVILGVFSVSMLSFSSKIIQLRYYLIILLGLVSVILSKHSFNQWIWLGTGLCICGFSYLFTYNNMDFLLLILIAFSVSTLSPKKILVSSILVILGSLFIIYLLAYFNVIPNLIFYRDNVARQSLGTMYPLTFAGFVFFCCAGAIVTNNSKSRKKNIIISLILLIASYFVYKVNGARNDALNIIFLLLCNFSKFIPDKVNNVLSRILSIAICFFAFITMFISNIIPYTSNLYLKLNSLFSGRLQLQYSLFSMYKPMLLEQNIEQNGLGRTAGIVMNYFYIDSSYIRVLFMGGILLFILFSLTLFSYLYRMINCRLYLLVYVTLVIIISGITENSVINTLMNIFIPLLLINNNIMKRDFEIKHI